MTADQIKQHQLTRGVTSQYGRMYQEAADSVHEHLLRQVEIEPVGELEDREPRNFTVLCDSTWGQLTPRVEHLACFAGGMFALGGKLLDRADDANASASVSSPCALDAELRC